MYSYFEGKIEEISPTHVVIDCGGIGYFLNISLNTYSDIKGKANAKVYAHLHLREDKHSLYGFSTKNECEMFRLLISVSGVGANTAQLILSSMTPAETANAISGENADALKAIKGIGAKSAQRLILDLKDKVKKDESQGEFLDSSHNTLKEQALTGLTMLGFNKNNAAKAINRILNKPEYKGSGSKNDLSVEQVIKEALKLL